MSQENSQTTSVVKISDELICYEYFEGNHGDNYIYLAKNYDVVDKYMRQKWSRANHLDHFEVLPMFCLDEKTYDKLVELCFENRNVKIQAEEKYPNMRWYVIFHNDIPESTHDIQYCDCVNDTEVAIQAALDDTEHEEKSCPNEPVEFLNYLKSLEKKEIKQGEYGKYIWEERERIFPERYKPHLDNGCYFEGNKFSVLLDMYNADKKNFLKRLYEPLLALHIETVDNSQRKQHIFMTNILWFTLNAKYSSRLYRLKKYQALSNLTLDDLVLR